mmetsp:Transcript_116376/g.202021  ORF Transcript_116376/g.202021 Transcript_116376/m.202021 type:complete len:94 (+) Transcript_116376:520-801(+)
MRGLTTAKMHRILGTILPASRLATCSRFRNPQMKHARPPRCFVKPHLLQLLRIHEIPPLAIAGSFIRGSTKSIVVYNRLFGRADLVQDGSTIF